jgi:peptidoglycan hydrolase-like protein with peptidoglycan-binding domain
MAMKPVVPGETGKRVSAMQEALVSRGYSVGPAGIDGKFGPDTTAALEAFQDNEALTVRPSCDEATWLALGLPKEE